MMLAVCEKEVVALVGVCPTTNECVYELRDCREEIIRCRYCKHFDGRENMWRLHGHPFCIRDFDSHLPCDPNGFCAWAERDA